MCFMLQVFLDCFVHERKHQVVKRAGESVKNTSSYEASVLGRVMLQQLRQLQETSLADTLLGKTTSDEGLATAFGCPTVVAKSLQHGGMSIGVGDILFVEGGEVALVKACICPEAQGLSLLLAVLVRVRMSHAHSFYREAPLQELRCLVLDGSVRVALAHCWAFQGGGDILVLHSRER